MTWDGILSKIVHVMGKVLATPSLVGSEEERDRRLQAVHSAKQATRRARAATLPIHHSHAPPVPVTRTRTAERTTAEARTAKHRTRGA